VYAVLSRRAGGLSVGVNCNPDAGCTFRCLYCQVDRTRVRPPGGVDPDRIEAELDALLGRLAAGTAWVDPPFDTVLPERRILADVALAGDGEPTACRRFDAVVAAAIRARDRHGFSAVPVRLLTNASRLHLPGVRRGLARLDAAGGEIWAKLDAGTDEAYRRMNRSRVPFARILANLADAAHARPIVVQSLFVTLGGRPPDPVEVDAWAARIAQIVDAGGRIREVQVTTLARVPSDPSCGPLDETALEAIAARVRARGVPVRVWPGLPVRA
jgi:wyosine [tRNA(Phe)-imidazoG37] synthetase (radical SAM superfamily)